MKMTGKGSDQFDAEYSERFLPFWRKKLGLDEHSGIVIEEPKDIRDILKDYYQYLLSQTTLPEPPEQEYLNVCNVSIPLGFSMIWGAADYLKSHIACAIANEAFARGERVVYFDNENKIEKKMLSKGIYYVPGTAKTSQVARKLATNHLFDFYVFDTIYAMSDYEQTLRSLVKHGRPNKVRYLLINQHSVDISSGRKVPSGAETIKEFSITTNRVVKKASTEKTTFVKFDNGTHFFFNVTDRGLVYDQIQSRFLAAINNAEIIKLGKEYKYAGRLMSRAQIIAEWQQQLQQERLEMSSKTTSSKSSDSTQTEPRRQPDPEQSLETPTSTEPASP
jgi:hypothetical protein